MIKMERRPGRTGDVHRRVHKKAPLTGCWNLYANAAPNARAPEEFMWGCQFGRGVERPGTVRIGLPILSLADSK